MTLMTRFATRVRRTLLRLSDALYDDGARTYGAVPAVLIAATVVTGVVDAVSYLDLRHIFVANMTGNVVFLGFALAGAKGVSVWAPCLAIGAFVGGAVVGGRIAEDAAAARERRLLRGALVHAASATAALIVAVCAATGTSEVQATLTALLAFGLGCQNAVVRALAVPDLTTTVLTLAVAGIAADQPGKATVRRLVSVACILLGALAGSLVALHHGAAAALTLDVVLLGAVVLLARIASA